MDPNLKWFHGKISHEKCENLLQNEFCEKGGKDQVFLVRESTRSNDNYVLSILDDHELFHFPITRDGRDAFFKIAESEFFHGIDELIRNCNRDYNNKSLQKLNLKHFVKGNFPPLKDCKFGMTTCLHVAVVNRDLNQITYLLKSLNRCMNISADDKNEDGKTALHIALSDNLSLEISKFLMEQNASLFLRDAAGKTPLFYAIENNLIEIVELMVSKNREIIQTRDSETLNAPLHVAARLGRLEIARILLQNNASQRPVNKEGKLPIELAAHNNHADIVKLLESHRTNSMKHVLSHNEINRSEAKSLLKTFRYHLKNQNKNDEEIAGIFLLRLSKNINKYVITMLCGDEDSNFEICQTDDYHHFVGGSMHGSIDDLITYHSEFSDGLPAKLTIPLKPDDEFYDARSSMDSVDSEFEYEPDYEEIGPIGDMYEYLKKSTPVAEVPDVDNLYVNEAYLDVSDQKLGSGNFGTVHKGLLAIPGHVVPVAVKTLIIKEDSDSSELFCSFLREAGTMMNFDNPFIVKMIGIVKGPPMKIVQELQSLGSLDTYLMKESVIDQEVIQLWAAQIADGMCYLEAKRFVHRDLAARNILLASKTHAKISDFGLSRPISIENGSCYVGEREKVPYKWYAPETLKILERKKYTHASDVWSFGITIWEIYSRGAIPFQNKNYKELITYLEKGGRLQKPTYCPEQVYEKLLDCWRYNSIDRPKFDELRCFFDHFAPSYANVDHLVTSNLTGYTKLLTN